MRGPPGRTAVTFVTILGLFLAPFRDKIAATSDQMRFFGRKMLKNAFNCGITALPQRAYLFTVDSRRVMPAR